MVLGQFLTSIFVEGKNPSTVRAYLSAIAWSHNRVSYNLENLELSWKLKTYLWKKEDQLRLENLGISGNLILVDCRHLA